MDFLRCLAAQKIEQGYKFRQHGQKLGKSTERYFAVSWDQSKADPNLAVCPRATLTTFSLGATGSGACDPLSVGKKPHVSPKNVVAMAYKTVIEVLELQRRESQNHRIPESVGWKRPSDHQVQPEMALQQVFSQIILTI
ncbi:hypothetical protein DUI87_06726 [Hirundo rustica rustica]|uniref:Uncharacterized protein n=1 Tax=Hirundo rustica rustica TaxID=333673 RepID=A0A3M0KSX4_HIRRU|nr:hypothetical protein DUI87_06726 [Hirundo rustica rustica]